MLNKDRGVGQSWTLLPFTVFSHFCVVFDTSQLSLRAFTHMESIDIYNFTETIVCGFIFLFWGGYFQVKEKYIDLSQIYTNRTF